MASQFQIRSAAQAIQAGAVIAYPTEAVFGLGCDPQNPLAVETILNIKRRPVEKGMILLASSVDQIEPYVIWTEAQRAQAESIWANSEQATTLLIQASEYTPEWVRGRFEKVAVRVTHHPIAKALCEEVGHPIISTSANRAGQPALEHAWQIQLQLKSEVDGVLSGVCPARNPSTIMDLETAQVLR